MTIMQIMREEDGDPVLFRFRSEGHARKGDHEQRQRQSDGNDDGDDADDFFLLQAKHLRIKNYSKYVRCSLHKHCGKACGNCE